MEMNKENNTPFKAEDVNWDELAGIGILKDELEMSGELDSLLPTLFFCAFRTSIASADNGSVR